MLKVTLRGILGATAASAPRPAQSPGVRRRDNRCMVMVRRRDIRCMVMVRRRDIRCMVMVRRRDIRFMVTLRRRDIRCMVTLRKRPRQRRGGGWPGAGAAARSRSTTP